MTRMPLTALLASPGETLDDSARMPAERGCPVCVLRGPSRGFDSWLAPNTRDGCVSFLCEESTVFVRGRMVPSEAVYVDGLVDCMACLASMHYEAYASNVVAWEVYRRLRRKTCLDD